MAIKAYFATIGRNKKGFSIVAQDKKGNPLYLGGVRGSVERNAVRYYFALQTYMDSLKLPSEQRFEKRINQWYDLTARYPIQLYELDKEDYLANKHREYTNQITLQSKSARWMQGEILAEMRLEKYRGLSTVIHPSASGLRAFISFYQVRLNLMP